MQKRTISLWEEKGKWKHLTAGPLRRCFLNFVLVNRLLRATAAHLRLPSAMIHFQNDAKELAGPRNPEVRRLNAPGSPGSSAWTAEPDAGRPGWKPGCGIWGGSGHSRGLDAPAADVGLVTVLPTSRTCCEDELRCCVRVKTAPRPAVRAVAPLAFMTIIFSSCFTFNQSVPAE